MSDVVVLTPSNPTSPVGAGSPAIFASRAVRNPATQVWTPSDKVPNNEHSDFDILGNNGRGLSLSELQKLKADAEALAAREDPDEAEQKFRDALSGFRHQLSSTHAFTADTAYQLASFYAKQQRMKEADEVLNWLSEEHCSRWGLWHSRTLSHYLVVVEELQAWSRDASAKFLAYGIYEALRDEWSRKKFVLVPAWNRSWDIDACGVPDNDVTDRLFVESEDEVRIDRQVRIANLWLVAGLQGTEHILPCLITRFEERPNRLLQALAARCYLLKNYIRKGEPNSAESEAALARKLLGQLMSEHETGILPGVLLESIKLAFLHLDNNDANWCDRLISWTSDKLEDSVSKWTGAGINYRNLCQIRNAGSTITYLILAGFKHQRRSGWENASSWFEQAYSFSSRVFGPRDQMTQNIEMAIKGRHYPVEDLLGLENTESNLAKDIFFLSLCLGN